HSQRGRPTCTHFLSGWTDQHSLKSLPRRVSTPWTSWLRTSERFSSTTLFSSLQIAKSKQLFCKLTLRHLNRQPHHVLRHVNGKRFKKALCKYEECVKQGIEFVPAALKQKRPKGTREDPRERPSNQGSKSWEPSSSDDDQSDSEDSMSDLYPPTMFTLKNQAEDATHCVDNEAEDNFKTDEEEEMEVESQGLQKRKKVQGGGFQKKFRNNNYKNKSGRKKSGKVPNGK
uniref:Surfeit 2 n=1 Tax=Gasterosteus aculeatus aculeatus TaxID=481459 RepID=G3PWK5_GASAC